MTLSWWEKNPDLRHWKKQPEKLLISASCINSQEDIKMLSKIPCDAVLIGNSAMKAADRLGFLNSLRKTKKKIIFKKIENCGKRYKF